MTFDPKAESKITSQNNTSNVNIQDGGPASKTSQNFRLWSGNDALFDASHPFLILMQVTPISCCGI